MVTLGDFLKSLTLAGVLSLFQTGVFKTLEILREVVNHINERLVFNDEILSASDHELYGLLRAQIRQLELVKNGSNDPLMKNKSELEAAFQSYVDKEKRYTDSTSSSSNSRPAENTASADTFNNNYAAGKDNEAPCSSARPSTIRKRPFKASAVENRSVEYITNDDDDTDCGNEFFEKKGESEAFIKKFGLTARRLEFIFKDQTQLQPLDWLKQAFEALLTHIARGFQPDDFVGVVIENEDYPNRPVGVPFRKLSQLNADVVLDIIAKIMQSNAEFFVNNKMTIRLDAVKLPTGNGYSALDGKCVTFNEHCLQKNSIFVVELANLCLAGALIISLEYNSNNFDRKSLSKYKGARGVALLESEARKLCNSANVDISGGANYNHLKQFQQHLKNMYNIVVYDRRDGSSVYFKGEVLNKPCLNLLMEDNHFNVILSLTGAFSTTSFCEQCLVRYHNQTRHKNCPFRCSSCLTSPPCSDNNVIIKCPDCLRVFKGDDCLKKHKSTKLCDKLKRCPSCLVQIEPSKKNSKRHVCGRRYCYTCKADKEIRHLCFMPTDVLSFDKKEKGKQFLFVFYDLEARQEKKVSDSTYLHEPNLCVVQQVCRKCVDLDNHITVPCQTCGVRQKIFKNNPVASLLNHIAEASKKFNVTAVAHNAKSYDAQFVLQHIFSDFSRWRPEIIRTGLKIMTISCGDSVRFIDSLNFIQLPLASFPTTFKIEGVKGWFPHYFNTTANENYVGPLPPPEFYGYSTMGSKQMREFLTWHAELVRNNYIFDMRQEIVNYCVSDVDLLRRGCLKFRLCFLQTTGVDPLLECITIASACNKVYRRNFLKPNLIGIIPRGGYRLADNQSLLALCWLAWLERTQDIYIQHAGNGREHRLKENILVDGFNRELNTVYDFNGCFFHGCRRCFPDAGYDLADKRESLASRYERQQNKEYRIRNAGYTLVTKWECDFLKDIEANEELKQFVRERRAAANAPLDVRESFYGGRTNACKLYYKCEPGEKIMYFDVCSLYPYVNKYGIYPVGHPVNIHVGHENCVNVDLMTTHGFVKCTILPPTNLYHPVLPYKCHNRLMFPLCKACAETLNQNECEHSDAERQFTGTFVSLELQKALQTGYKIVELMEIWEYNTIQYDKVSKSGGLFSSYVNTFLKIKQECSGWPAWCDSADKKEQYLREYREREGIELTPANIAKNPGMRFIAKTALNSLWGKFAQRSNLQQTSLVNQPYKLFELLSSPATVVHDLTIINPEILLTTWEKVEEDVLPSATTNVAIASFTTAAARLELYKYLELLGSRILYFDTDSVFFIHKEGDPIPATGDWLGDLTDEMSEYGAESRIVEFVSGGPKNYAYSFWNGRDKKFDSVCKVKGITMHNANQQQINFSKMKEMVCNEQRDSTVVIEDKQIVKDKRFNVMTTLNTKTYRINYNKRRRLNSFDTVPYGYKN